jgi:hypothetical protein
LLRVVPLDSGKHFRPRLAVADAVNLAEFFQLLLQPNPQRALRPEFIKQRQSLLKGVRLDFTVLSEQFSETTLDFRFRQQRAVLAQYARGNWALYASELVLPRARVDAAGGGPPF